MLRAFGSSQPSLTDAVIIILASKLSYAHPPFSGAFLLGLNLCQGGHGGDGAVAGGGEGGGLVGEGDHGLQVPDIQAVQAWAADQAGEEGPEEGVPCPVGVPYRAGHAGHRAGGVSVPVEGSPGAQGHEDEADAKLRERRRARGQVLRPGEQGQLLVGDLQDVRKRQGRAHLRNSCGFVRPEGGTIVGVIAHQRAQLTGPLRGVQGGGLGRLGGETDTAEVEDPGGLEHGLRNLLRPQLHVGAGVPVEAEMPLAGAVQAHHRQGGAVRGVRHQAGDVHAVVHKGGLQKLPEAVPANLADEGRFRPQAGGRHRQIGRGAAGVGVKAGDALVRDAALGEVDEDLAHRCDVYHIISSIR